MYKLIYILDYHYMGNYRKEYIIKINKICNIIYII